MAQVNRYTTVVTWAKVTLPLIALALLSTMFLFSSTPDPDAALPFAEIDIEQLAREQRLSQPRFAGTLEDGREVTLVSETAAPTLTNPNVIHLERVEAEVALSASDRLSLTAVEGDIDMAEQSADLAGDVVMITTQGYQLESDAMRLNMGDMEVVSPGRVSVTGPGLFLNAGAMHFSGPDGGAILRFTGGVRLLYEGQRESTP